MLWERGRFPGFPSVGHWGLPTLPGTAGLNQSRELCTHPQPCLPEMWLKEANGLTPPPNPQPSQCTGNFPGRRSRTLHLGGRLATVGGLGIPSGDGWDGGRVFSPSCHVSWTDPPNVSFPLPGRGLPLPSFPRAPSLLLLPPRSQRSLGLHNTGASLSPGLQTSILPGSAVPVSTLSVAVAISAARGLPVSPPGLRALTGRRPLWDPAESGGWKGWGQGTKCGRTLHPDPPGFCGHKGLGSRRSPGACFYLGYSFSNMCCARIERREGERGQ